jgi:hypothetical protein
MANIENTTIIIIIASLCFTVLMIILSAVAAIFIIRWVRKSYGSGAVQNGVSASATIQSYWDTGTTINDNPLVGFQLQITPPGGQPFLAECKQMISRLDVGSLRPGAPVTVSYDPANPKKIKITAFNVPPIAQYGVPGSPTPMNSAEIEQKIRKIDADNQSLIARGQPAQAEVLRYTDWNVKINGENPMVTLSLRVMPPGKPQFMAEASGVISVASVPRFQPGKSIWVKYDPNNLTQVTVDHS